MQDSRKAKGADLGWLFPVLKMELCLPPKFESKKRDASHLEILEITSMHKTIEPSILVF